MSDIIHYESDPDHSFVTFAVKHFATSTVRGRFDDVAGTVDLDWGSKKGHADVVIQMASINTGSKFFDNHLKTEILKVDEHPQARFVGENFQWQGEQLVAVGGALTLAGQTHPLTLRCENFNRYDSPVLNAPVAGGDFVASLERSQWGVDWGLKMGIPDRVDLIIQIEAAQTAPKAS